jgi:hypothetical protein
MHQKYFFAELVLKKILEKYQISTTKIGVLFNTKYGYSAGKELHKPGRKIQKI